MKGRYITIILILLVPMTMGCIFGKTLVGYTLLLSGLIGVAIIDFFLFYDWLVSRQKVKK